MIAVAKKQIIHVVGYAIRGGCERCCEVFIHTAQDFEHRVLVLGEAGPMSAVWSALGVTVTHLNALETGWHSFFRRLRAELDGTTVDGAIVWAGIRVPLVLAALAPLGCPTVLHPAIRSTAACAFVSC